EMEAHDGSSDSQVISHDVTLIVDPVARDPQVMASGAEMEEGVAPALSISVSNAGDLLEDLNDDSVTVTIHGLPSGAVLKQGSMVDRKSVVEGQRVEHWTARLSTEMNRRKGTRANEFEGQVRFTVRSESH